MVFQKRQQAEKRQAVHLRRARLASKARASSPPTLDPKISWRERLAMVRKLRAGAFVLSSKLVRTVEGKIHPTHQESFQLSEILGALSLATDLADGQPQGSAMGATVIATRIGGRLGLDRDALTELYWSVLLRFLGCTATAGQLAPAGFGVEQVLNHAFTAGDPYDAADMRRRLDAGLPLDVNPQERSARINRSLSCATVPMSLLSNIVSRPRRSRVACRYRREFLRSYRCATPAGTGRRQCTPRLTNCRSTPE